MDMNDNQILSTFQELTPAVPAAPSTTSTPTAWAAIRRPGRNVTLIAWSYSLWKTLEAAETLAKEGIEAEVIMGDARETLPAWQGRADAWFLDGFSPAKNPELWGDDLMAQVARHTAPHGTFATYPAAGHVRRALQAAGFAVTRQAGFARKRHMTTGLLP